MTMRAIARIKSAVLWAMKAKPDQECRPRSMLKTLKTKTFNYVGVVSTLPQVLSIPFDALPQHLYRYLRESIHKN